MTYVRRFIRTCGVVLSMALYFVFPLSAETIDYIYDDLGRLIQSRHSDNSVIRYKYDEVGNRVAQGDNTLVIDIPDLIITGISGPAIGVPNHLIAVSGTVRNQGGKGSGACTVGIYLSSDNIITTGDLLIGSINVNALAPNAQSQFNTTAMLSQSIAVGTYYVGAIVDLANVVGESDENNNLFKGNTIVVTTLPDLLPNSIYGPAIAAIGYDVLITYVVANQGGDAGTFRVGVYVSPDNAISSGDTQLGTSQIIGPISTDCTVSGSVTVAVPENFAAGTYYWGAIVDIDDSVAEFDEANNSHAGNQVTVTIQMIKVRIARTPTVYYPSVQAAYDAASDGDIIQSIADHFSENINANRNIAVTFEGGYNSEFSAITGNTTLHGSTTVANGTVTIKDFNLTQ